MYRCYVKRSLDVIISLIAMLIAAPICLVIAIVIKLDGLICEGSLALPVLFRQKRVGAQKTYFNIMKFRTMRVDAPRDVPTDKLSDSGKWITPVGRLLRRTSLDELPQLVHIFTGRMSIVGPRPALWTQDDLILERDKYQKRFVEKRGLSGRAEVRVITVNDLRPGLTGWAQINGRDELSIQEKAELDGEYLNLLGFNMDCWCLIRTIIAVISEKGIREGQ